MYFGYGRLFFCLNLLLSVPWHLYPSQALFITEALRTYYFQLTRRLNDLINTLTIGYKIGKLLLVNSNLFLLVVFV